MSKVIDERVVEMQFDNKNFEKNVSQSMSTLDKLKQKLNFKGASKGLEEINNSVKKVDMSPISSGIETVKIKFSALEVAAVTALQNITNRVVDTGTRLVKSLSVDQITAGWSKYSDKTASVQTIMNATGKSIDDVNGYLDKLMWFSDETSYGFTDMTSALGQMTSSGGDIEKIIPLIMGVANATAYAGKGAQQFSHVMYNLNQSYASGALKLMDWKSVELMGVGSKQLKQVLIDTAVELGKIQQGMVDIGSFNESLSKGWADREVMEKGFGKFATMMEEAYKLVEAGKFDTASEALESLNGKYDEYIERATKSAQEAKTFSEALDATKDAVSSGWMETFEIIFGNYEQAKVLWTDLANVLWDVFASGGEARNDLLREALGQESGWEELSKKIEGTGIAVEDFQNGLIETAKAHGIAVDDMISEAGSFEESLKSGWLTGDIFNETINKYVDGSKEFVSSTEDMSGKLEEFQKVFDGIWSGKYGNGEDRFKALTDAGYDYAKVQDLVNRHGIEYKLTLEDLNAIGIKAETVVKGDTEAIKALADEARTSGSSIEDLVNSLSKPSGRELLISSMSNAINGLLKILDVFKWSWNEAFPPIKASNLYQIIESLNKFSKRLILSSKNTAKLSISLRGIFSVVRLLTDILSGGFKASLEIASAFVDELNFGVLDLTMGFGKGLKSLTEWIRENESLKRMANSIKNVLIGLASTLGSYINRAYIWITSNEKINAGIAKIISSLGRCVNKVADFITSILGTKKAQNFLDGFFEFVGKAIETFIEFLAEGSENVADFIEGFGELNSVSDVIDLVVSKFGELITSFGSLKNLTLQNVIGIFTGFQGEVEDALYGTDLSFVSFQDKLELLKFNANKNLLNIGSKFSWLQERVVGFLDLAESKIPSVLALGGAAILITSLNNISKALDILATPIKIIKDSVSALTTAIKNIGKAVAFSQQAGGILKIGLAIGILAYSLYQLSSIPAKDLYLTVGALSIMTAVLGGLAIALGMLEKMGLMSNIGGSAKSIIAMGAALYLLAQALKVMEGMDAKDALGNALVLGALGIALGIAVGIFNKIAGDAKSGMSFLSLITMAGALFILALTLEKLRAFKFEDMTDAIKTMGVLVLMLGALSMASSKVKFGSGIGVLGMVLGLKLFLDVFDEILDYPYEKIQNGINSLAGIVGTMSILLIAMSFAGSNAGKAGFGMLAVSVSLIILIKAVQMISDTPRKDLDKATDVISQLLLVFGAVIALSYFAGENIGKVGGMLIQMSLALLIITGVMYLLTGLVEEGNAGKALGIVTVLEILFGGLIYVTKYAKDVKTGVIISLTVAITAIAAVVMLLSTIPTENLVKGELAIAGIIGALSALIWSLKSIENVKTGKTALVIAGLVLIVGGLTILIQKLTENDPKPTLEIAASISIILLAIGGVCKLLNGMNTNVVAAIPVILTLTAAVGLIGFFLVTFANMTYGMDMGHLIEVAGSLSLVLISLAAVTAILSKFGGGSLFGTIEGLGSMIIVIGVLGTILTALGGLVTAHAEIGDALLAGIDFLSQVFFKLGEAVGNIISGFATGITNGLSSIADNLNNFMEKISVFMEGAANINEESLTGVKTLAEVILTLSGASVLSGLSSLFNFFKSPVDVFVDGITSLAEGMKEYSDAVSGENAPDNEAIKNSVTAAKLLVDLQNSLPKGGVFTKIFGEKNLGNFGSQLAAFGSSLKEYSDAVSGDNIIDLGAIQNSVDAAAILVQFSDTIPVSGLVQAITGMKDLGNFGEQIKKFGFGLVGYCLAIRSATIDANKVDASVEVAKKLTELNDYIPESGFLPWLKGETNLGDFGTKIKDFGAGLAAYCTSISGAVMDSTKVDQSVAVATSISDLAKALPEDKLFDGKMNLTDFGTQLYIFSGDFKNFAANITNVDITALLTASNIIINLSNMLKSLSGIDPEAVTTFVDGINKLGELSVASIVESFSNSTVEVSNAIGTMLDNAIMIISIKQESFRLAGNMLVFAFASSFTSSTELISQSITGLITSIVMSINLNAPMLQMSGFMIINQFALGIQLGTVNVTTAITTMLTTEMNIINAYLLTFNSAGLMLMIQLSGGINLGAPNVTMAISTLMSACVESISSNYQAFYDSGIYLVEGLLEGIKSQEEAVYNAAKALGAAAVKGEREGQDSHSPSVPMIQSGVWLGEGMIIGLRKITGSVYKASNDIGKTSVDGIREAIQSIDTAFDEDVEYTPKIRPIVDMNAIDKSKGIINSVFNTRRSLTLAGTIDKANIISKKVDEIQNGNNDAISSPSMTFNQYNYSPKALSRLDIYRNTKNQFTMAKEAVSKR